MTQEDKQLLLKDLCARVPYKPKVKVLHVWNEDKEIEEDIMDTVYCVLPDGYINTETIDSDIPFMDVILYLRPMSSMTDEEEGRYNLLQGISHLAEQHWTAKDGKIYRYADAIDWLNERHFDYRGLIEKGLAIEAPEGIYE